MAYAVEDFDTIGRRLRELEAERDRALGINAEPSHSDGSPTKKSVLDILKDHLDAIQGAMDAAADDEPDEDSADDAAGEDADDVDFGDDDVGFDDDDDCIVGSHTHDDADTSGTLTFDIEAYDDWIDYLVRQAPERRVFVVYSDAEAAIWRPEYEIQQRSRQKHLGFSEAEIIENERMWVADHRD